jgi:hypothetical protein
MPQVSTFIPNDLKRRLESKCAKENKKPSEVLRGLILEYLEEQETTDNTAQIYSAKASVKILRETRDSLIEMRGEKIVGLTSSWLASNDVAFCVNVIFSSGRSLCLSSRFPPWIRTKEETNAVIDRELKKAEELREIRKEINIP